MSTRQRGSRVAAPDREHHGRWHGRESARSPHELLQRQELKVRVGVALAPALRTGCAGDRVRGRRGDSARPSTRAADLTTDPPGTSDGRARGRTTSSTAVPLEPEAITRRNAGRPTMIDRSNVCEWTGCNQRIGIDAIAQHSRTRFFASLHPVRHFAPREADAPFRRTTRFAGGLSRGDVTSARSSASAPPIVNARAASTTCAGEPDARDLKRQRAHGRTLDAFAARKSALRWMREGVGHSWPTSCTARSPSRRTASRRARPAAARAPADMAHPRARQRASRRPGAGRLLRTTDENQVPQSTLARSRS